MLALRIAIRYLLAKKSHRAVNIITLIAVIGVTIATMAVVLVLSIFNGFSDLALSRLSNLDPEISIVPKVGKAVVGVDSLAAVVKRTDGIADVIPVITERALIEAGEVRLPVVMKGVPAGYDSVSHISDIMLAGEYAVATSDPDATPAIQLSVGVANNVPFYPSPDSRVSLIVPRRGGRINPANPSAAFRGSEFAFSGVFRAGSVDIDNDHVIVPFDAAADLLDYENEATALEVVLRPEADPDEVRDRLSESLGSRYKVLDRMEQRADSFRMIAIEKWVTFMMLVCILVIAMFNIVSTLSLLAIEKRDNMQTLRWLGAPSKMVRDIFIAEGFLITVIGGAAGIVLGVVGTLLQQTFHIIKLSADEASLTINYYPVRLDPLDLLAVGAVIVVLALVVSGISRLIVRTPHSLTHANLSKS